jgi:nitrate/TMAO reductase-like tetraheme cytochrome c subunit
MIACAVVVGPVSAAFQNEQKKDADLPPEMAKQPFEIKDGYRRFVQRCTTCHDSKRVLEAKKSLFDWQGTIGKMAFKKGANIPQEDRQSIFVYLAYLHGTSGSPAEREQYLAFLQKCENCHGVGLMYKEKQPMKEWPEIIHRMAVKDQANITPEDEKKVMGYISRMHPDLFGID